MEIGFTGSRDGMTPDQEAAVYNFLLEQAGDVFRHGDCVGADEEAAAAAQGMGYYVIGHPPEDPRLRAFFPSDMNMPPKPYLVRNADIVAHSEIVIATPAKNSGGGTWWTINHAEVCKVPVYLVNPDGTTTWR